ncbi:MAG: hypothetical protein ICV83_22005, partial [Cytophagales bacterium]|nr:hypothetical protein [Cytophagales bacterium]
LGAGADEEKGKKAVAGEATEGVGHGQAGFWQRYAFGQEALRGGAFNGFRTGRVGVEKAALGSTPPEKLFA